MSHVCLLYENYYLLFHFSLLYPPFIWSCKIPNLLDRIYHYYSIPFHISVLVLDLQLNIFSDYCPSFCQNLITTKMEKAQLLVSTEFSKFFQVWYYCLITLTHERQLGSHSLSFVFFWKQGSTVVLFWILLWRSLMQRDFSFFGSNFISLPGNAEDFQKISIRAKSFSRVYLRIKEMCSFNM